MTITEFVLSQQVQGINEWLRAIDENGLNKHQHLILECANHYNMIVVNHNARFGRNSINKF